MSGYDYDRWISNNAVDAYESGEMPLSKWTKQEILDAAREEGFSAEEVRILSKKTLRTLKYYCLERSSWHHTSPVYNATDFYSFDSEGASRLIADPSLEVPAAKPDVPRDRHGRATPPGRYTADYDISVRGRRGWRSKWLSEVPGTVQGKYFIADDGTRKQLRCVVIRNPIETGGDVRSPSKKRGRTVRIRRGNGLLSRLRAKAGRRG